MGKKDKKKKKQTRFSQEEKLNALEKFFMDKKIPYSLAELSKNLVTKGIPALKSLRMPKKWKEVLGILEADGRLQSDKIGASMYFWCFPSVMSNKRKRKLEELGGEIEENEKKRRKLNEDIEQNTEGKELNDERKNLLDEKKDLKDQLKNVNSELKKYSDYDPEVMKDLKKKREVMKDGANRWTDNIYETKSYLIRKFNQDRKMVDKMFGINDSFDEYLEKTENRYEKQLKKIKQK